MTPADYSRVIAGVATVPSFLNWGDHWPLDNEEKKRAGEALAAAFDTLPDNNAASKVTELLGNALPWIGLSGTMFGIFAPRLAMTKMMAAQPVATDIAPEPTLTEAPYGAYTRVP